MFILGFSRGTYSVRSLVGLIRNAGLLCPEHGRRAADAYVLYRSRDEGRNPAVPAGGAAVTPKQPDPRQGKPPKGACDAVTHRVVHNRKTSWEAARRILRNCLILRGVFLSQ